MSTRDKDSKNEVEDEPEEGEIQDDEGSLEDVSSDDDLTPLSKRKERALYPAFGRIRGDFSKMERQQIMQTPQRGMRLRSTEQLDAGLQKIQGRLKSGCRTTGEHDGYYGSVRHKFPKEHCQKGRNLEKENKMKDSKKWKENYRRNVSLYNAGSELRTDYNTSEHTEPCLPSSTSSKVPWHKGDKEKHRKKKKNDKNNKFYNPVGGLVGSQLRTGNDSGCVNDVSKPNEHMGEAIKTQKGSETEEKSNVSPRSPSSPSSDIEIIDVPIIVPEVITICDSDDDTVLNSDIDHFDTDIISKEEVYENVQLSAETEMSPKKDVVEKEDPEYNLEILREAALKSSKPEACSNANFMDETLQLRLEALKSAIIRKYEERKKRGIGVPKRSKSASSYQMSISPLGSPNSCSSGDISDNTNDDVDQDLGSTIVFNVSSNLHIELDHINSSGGNEIANKDVKSIESCEDKEFKSSNNGDAFKTSEKMETSVSNTDKVIDETLKPIGVMNSISLVQDPLALGSSASPCSECSNDVSTGYIIGDLEQISASAPETNKPSSSPSHSLLESKSETNEKNNEPIVQDQNLLSGQGHSVLSDSGTISDNLHEKPSCFNCTSDLHSEHTLPSEIGDLNSLGCKLSCSVKGVVDLKGQGDGNNLSPECKDLDLESMIVLDEIGESSDDATLECIEEGAGPNLKKHQNGSCEENLDNPEYCIGNHILDSLKASKDNECVTTDGLKNCALSIASESLSSGREKPQRSENFEKGADDVKTCAEVPDIAPTLLLNTQDPVVNLEELSRLEVSEERIVVMDETSNLSRCESQTTVKITINESSGECVGSSNTLDKQERRVKHLSPENDGSVDSFYNVEEENSKLMSIQVLAPTCKESVICSTQDSETLHIPSQVNLEPGVEIREEECRFIADASFNANIGKNGNKNPENSAEEDEAVLRVNLLAMLKKSREEEIKKHRPESCNLLDEKGNKTCEISSKPQNISASQKVQSCSLQTISCSESVLPVDTIKNIDPDSLMKKACTAVLAKHQYFTRAMSNKYHLQSLSVNKQGPKNKKLRSRETKIPGRFNVNVPSLVIHLGEDSDSGEDIGNEQVKTDSVSDLNASDASQESRDNMTGSQSVPPDFEKKLDLLLKQARFQQETGSKDNKDVLSDNDLSMTSQSTTVKSPFTNLNVDAGKNNRSGSISTPLEAHTVSSVGKVLPVDVHVGGNKCEKNSSINPQSRTTRMSMSKVANANKKDIQNRMKNISSSVQPSSSASSAVDIRLLPSNKQKEYIRLKRQIARKEQEVKTKENVTSQDTARLTAGKCGVVTVKRLASIGVPGKSQKTCMGVNVERVTPFSQKNIKKGPGYNFVSRVDLLKTKRVVRTVSTFSPNSPRNRLTVTTPNRVGGASLEGSSIVRRVWCVPQKRIVTNSNSVKKVSPAIKVTTPNACLNSENKQRKLVSLVNKTTAECSIVPNESCEVKKVRAKNIGEEEQVNERHPEDVKMVQKKSIENVSLKRKDNNLEHSGMSHKKVAVDQGIINEESTEKFQPTVFPSKDVDSECSAQVYDTNCTLKGEKTTNLAKRKRSNSERSGVSNRRKVLHETTEHQIVHDNVSSNKNKNEKEILDRNIVEDLWSAESKLIFKRYQVVQDIATVQMNLREIEKENEMRKQIIENIERLRKELKHAEIQLSNKEELLETLYSEVENKNRDITRTQSETLLLSVECEEMGGAVHGSNYSVPNTCTDLIRNGMTSISKSLQDLKEGKCVKFSCESTKSHRSGETTTKGNELHENKTEPKHNSECLGYGDSYKQTPGSYLSPLEAIRTINEPSKNNQAVLCPYHIMGSCKDKECSYLH